MKKLLAFRNYTGYGDWIMAMTVLKHVNIQYPDVEIYIDTCTKGQLDPFIPQIVSLSGVKYKKLLTSLSPKDRGEETYDYVTGHMIYRRRGVHLIEDMIEVFNKNTGLSLQYDPVCKATMTSTEIVDLPERFIVMPIQGKAALQWGKEWGKRNFIALYELLRRHIDVVQVGFVKDEHFPGISVKNVFLGKPLSTLVHIMNKSLFGINIVNFLCHLYGHHEKKQYTLYGGGEDVRWTKYNNQVQLTASLRMNTPQEVYEIIKKENF